MLLLNFSMQEASHSCEIVNEILANNCCSYQFSPGIPRKKGFFSKAVGDYDSKIRHLSRLRMNPGVKGSYCTTGHCSLQTTKKSFC